MTYNKWYFAVILLLISLLSGCYSFRGISIDRNVTTYYVENFKNNATSALPAMEQLFTENLKEKIRTDTRLIYNDETPDIEFKGTLVDFRISSEAPQPGELVAINRLTIVLAIEFINHLDEEKNWRNNFSHFFDFSSSTDFAAVQDEAVEAIQLQLMEDIFNKAFTDW
jgi:hypothetical protein